MSHSCIYPDRKSEHSILRSPTFAEELSHFDLESVYTNVVENEIQLFYSAVFGIDMLTTTCQDVVDKGSIETDSVDTITFNWDDIPVLHFTVHPDEEDGYMYGHIITCKRLYDIEDGTYVS